METESITHKVSSAEYINSVFNILSCFPEDDELESDNDLKMGFADDCRGYCQCVLWHADWPCQILTTWQVADRRTHGHTCTDVRTSNSQQWGQPHHCTHQHRPRDQGHRSTTSHRKCLVRHSDYLAHVSSTQRVSARYLLIMIQQLHAVHRRWHIVCTLLGRWPLLLICNALAVIIKKDSSTIISEYDI